MFWESILIAWEGLIANKLRTALTMLGIIIGVGAVIAMISIGLGVQQKVQSSISSLGSNLLVVMPGASSSAGGGVRQAAGSNITLTYTDAKAIGKSVSGIANLAPAVSSSYQLVYGNQNWKTSVQGTTPDQQAIRSYTLAAGSFISSRDENDRARVVVLGNTVATNLFGNASAIGKMIRIDKAPFRVIGVLDAKGQSSMGQDQDDIAIIPITTAQERLLGITYIHSISVQMEREDLLDKAQEDITTLLRSRHHLAATAENDFSVRNLTALMSTMQETTGTMTIFLGAIAAISLLVGGIGIMNIMLVSVTERTREIGIRKAIGATFSNILLQFLIEAMVVSVSGGLVGIFLGIGAAYAITSVFGWQTVISPLSIGASFGITVVIGLFFGIYPARKAALLDPIDALRYE